MEKKSSYKPTGARYGCPIKFISLRGYGQTWYVQKVHRTNGERFSVLIHDIYTDNISSMFYFSTCWHKKIYNIGVGLKGNTGSYCKVSVYTFFFCYLSFLLSWFRYRPYIFPVTVDYGLWSMSYVLIKILLPLDSIDLSITLELSIFPVTLCEWHTRTSHSNTFSW